MGYQRPLSNFSSSTILTFSPSSRSSSESHSVGQPIVTRRRSSALKPFLHRNFNIFPESVSSEKINLTNSSFSAEIAEI